MTEAETNAFLSVDRHLVDLLTRLQLVGDLPEGRLRDTLLQEAKDVAEILRTTIRDVGVQVGVGYPE